MLGEFYLTFAIFFSAFGGMNFIYGDMWRTGFDLIAAITLAFLSRMVFKERLDGR